jgi:hypothetical protein
MRPCRLGTSPLILSEGGRSIKFPQPYAGWSVRPNLALVQKEILPSIRFLTFCQALRTSESYTGGTG